MATFEYSGLIFLFSSALIGFRDVFWPYSVRGNPSLEEIAQKKGGKELLGFAFMLGALLVSLLGCIFISPADTSHEISKILNDGTLIGYVVICSIATALAWLTSMLAGFAAIGPTKVGIIDWGSLPAFGILVGLALGTEMNTTRIVAGLTSGLAVLLLLFKKEFLTIVNNHRSVTIAPNLGVFLALASSFFGAVMIAFSAKLKSLGISPILVLPLRIAVTCLLMLIIFAWEKREDTWHDAMSLFSIGLGATFTIAIASMLYSVPFLFCFYYLDETNYLSFGIALTLIPVASYFSERFIFKNKPELNKTESICYFLFLVGIVLSLLKLR